MLFRGELIVIALSIELLGLSGCSTQPIPQNGSQSIKSRLSPTEVKKIAASRARANGFKADASNTWMIALQPREQGYVWSIQLAPEAGQTPYWLFVDDATGKAEFVMPIIKAEQLHPENADWLFKVDEAIKQTTFPIELEQFMRSAHFAGATPSGGGSTEAGRFFLEYDLRTDRDVPARFEIRCYYTMPEGDTGPKMVTAAELAYWDTKLYRYLLVRSAN